MGKEDYYNPNPSEQKLIIENKPYSDKAISLAYNAGLISSLFYFRFGDGDESDAFRHCLWSAFIARETDLQWAKKWTDAHEDIIDNPWMSKEMDIHNNDMGIEILKNNLQASPAIIIQSCIELIKNGKLRIIKNNKIQPTTINGFSIPSILDVIKNKIDYLFDYFLSFQIDEVKKVNTEKEGALHFCIRNNYVYGVNEILRLSLIDVNSSNLYGDIPLVIAIKNNCLEIFYELIKNKANINKQRQSDRETPLMVAAVYGRLEMTKSLLAFGANKALRSSTGFTAKEIAENEDHQEIVKLLT
jgi:hypothetical protein